MDIPNCERVKLFDIVAAHTEGISELIGLAADPPRQTHSCVPTLPINFNINPLPPSLIGRCHIFLRNISFVGQKDFKEKTSFIHCAFIRLGLKDPFKRSKITQIKLIFII